MIYPAFDVVIYRLWKSFFVESVFQYKFFPLWNPYLFSGAPFVGNSESAMFYPFNLLYLISKVDLVFGWVFILDIFLLGVGVYLFARTINLYKSSALLSSIVMMFSGTVISRLIPGHIMIIDGITWYPFLFILFEKSLQTNKLIYGAISAIPLSLMVLSGNIQIAAYALLSIIIYSLIMLLIDRFRRKNNLTIKTIILVPIISVSIAALFSAIQLLPSKEFVSLSTRGSGVSYDFASDFALHPYQSITFILPHFFGAPLDATFWGKGNLWEECGYLGILPLILAFIALIFKRNKYTIAFFFLMLFAYLFSLGRYGPLFEFFYKHVPGFNNFRAPARILFIYAFSISILAGNGMQYLTQKNIPIKKITSFLLGSFFLIGIAYLYLFFNLNIEMYEHIILRNSFAVGINHYALQNYLLNDVFFLLVIFYAITFVFIFKAASLTTNTIFKTSLLLIVIIDLWIFGINLYKTKNPSEIYKPTKEIQVIKRDKGLFRVFDLTGNIPDENIQVVTGYDPLILKSYQDFLWLAGPHENAKNESFFLFNGVSNIRILKLLNVKYVISKKPLQSQELEKIYQDKYILYRIKNVLPRAFIISNAQIITDSQKMLGILKKNDFNPETYVLLNKIPKAPLINNARGSSVTISLYEPDKIELSANMKSSGFLLLSEIFYPGWKAYDNGEEIEIYQADYALRSLFLQKGNHRVVFRYKPQSFFLGLSITIISLSLYILFLIFYYNKHRKMNIKLEKNLDKAHEDVPGNYYHEAIKRNILQRFWHLQRIKYIKKMLNTVSANNVLDVGCHGGRLTYELQKRLPEAKIYGIDISKQAIAFAQKKYKQISFQVGRAEKLPFAPKSFDLVTCLEVLEHVPSPHKVILETRRVLKKKGHLIILVPSENMLFRTIWYFWTHLGRGRVWHHTHVQKFTNKNLDELLINNGFEVKEKKLFILKMLMLIYAVKK